MKERLKIHQQIYMMMKKDFLKPTLYKVTALKDAHISFKGGSYGKTKLNLLVRIKSIWL